MTKLPTSSTSKTEVAFRTVPARPVKKPKVFLVVYRTNVRSMHFEANWDKWFFASLSTLHYATMGYSLDVIMLMDGITQQEFMHDSGYTAIYPSMKLETIILEAG